MAPAAKRKKPGDDDPVAKAAPKPRAKKQKTTDADPTAAIETPPPTPKAAAPRGRKPAAAKTAKVNGNHIEVNGVARAAPGDIAASSAEGADIAGEAPAVKPVTSTLKRKVIEDDEDEAAHNGVTNGAHASGSGPTLQNGLGSGEQAPLQNADENIAKDATPAIPVLPAQTLDVPPQPVMNGNRTSTTPAAESSNTIRLTTEKAPPTMEPPQKKAKFVPKERELRQKLYDYCIKAKPVGEIYSIEELKHANVTDDPNEMLQLCQSLVSHFQFAPMTLNRGIVYKTRSMDVAKKVATLSENGILIYSLIENNAGQGAWLRPLESKSRLHQSVVRKCLKELLTLKIVKEIKSAETSKKVYISVDCKPDEKHIGGGFVDEGKFEEGMIASMTGVTVHFLTELSWYVTNRRVSEREHHHGSSKDKQKDKHKHKDKDQPATTITIATEEEPKISKARPLYPPWEFKGKQLLPHNASFYPHYPTTLELMIKINESGALKGIVLTHKDMEQLLTKMVFDGYVERMRDQRGELNMKEPRWRTTKRVWRMNAQMEVDQHFGNIEAMGGEILPGNGISQVPCLRCPVKSKCKPGGVVNPEECRYLGDWLDF